MPSTLLGRTRVKFFKENEIKIQILSTGCAKCKTLAKNVKTAVAAAGIDAEIEKVEDIKDDYALWGDEYTCLGD